MRLINVYVYILGIAMLLCLPTLADCREPHHDNAYQRGSTPPPQHRYAHPSAQAPKAPPKQVHDKRGPAKAQPDNAPGYHQPAPHKAQPGKHQPSMTPANRPHTAGQPGKPAPHTPGHTPKPVPDGKGHNGKGAPGHAAAR